MGKEGAKVRKASVDAEFTEGVQAQSFLNWAAMKIDNMFVDNIPLDAIKDLPLRYMYFAGKVAALKICCFCVIESESFVLW